MQINDRVCYQGGEYLVADIGEDGSLALTPVMGSGPTKYYDGEVELTAEQAAQVRLVATYR